MSKVKFTPGPFEAVLQLNEDGPRWFDIWSPKYGSLAHLSEHARLDESVKFLKGDAALFAAAPDLYRVLENIANARPEGWSDPTEFVAWAQNRARHALEKARGES